MNREIQKNGKTREGKDYHKKHDLAMLTGN